MWEEIFTVMLRLTGKISIIWGMRGINFTGIGKLGKIFEPEITRSELFFGTNNLVAIYGRLQSERRERNKIRAKL